MTADEEKELLAAIKQLQYDVAHLLRYATAFAAKFDVLGVQPPRQPIARKTRT